MNVKTSHFNASPDDIGRSGKAVQFAIFVAGLCLSVFFYLFLNSVVGKMAENEGERVVTLAEQQMNQALNDARITMRNTSFLADTFINEQNPVLKKRIIFNIPGIDAFDKLLYVEVSDTNKWRAEEIFEGRDVDAAAILNGANQEETIHFVLANWKNQRGRDLIVMHDVPGMQYIQESTDPYIRNHPFLMVYDVSETAQGSAILIGLTSIQNILDRGWLEQNRSVQRLSVIDNLAGYELYLLGRGAKTYELSKSMKEGIGFDVQMGNQQWRLYINPGMSEQMRIIYNAPEAFLILFLLLTLLAVLYYRHDQKQASFLRSMNKTLSQKNYELNAEISEREKLNQSIKKAEREYRAIIDAVSDAIFEVDTEGKILFLNDTWSKITGLKSDDIIGQSIFDFIHPDNRREEIKSFKALVDGDKLAYRSITQIRDRKGAYRAVEIAISMMRQDKDKNTRVVGTLTDVEDRARFEKALNEAEEKYRTIVENAAGGIYQSAPDGVFLSANPAMGRLVGFQTPDELLANSEFNHDFLYVNAEDRQRYKREMETFGVVQNFEAMITKKNGERIWVNENARAVKGNDGAVLYYEGSMEDITARKKAEINLIEAKQQSDIANRAKSEFLANMSHELRTPLNSIIGFAEIIKNEMLGPLENRQYWEYASDIHTSGEKLLKIINEILDLSKIEVGERHLEEGLIDPHKVIIQALDFIDAKIEENNLVLKNLSEPQKITLLAEELALKQIVLNVLTNAVKFTPQGGRITIASEVGDDGRYRLAITDTGIGMSADEVKKAISPFGQIETSLDRKGSGAGLGLSIVSSLVKLHQGELDVFSQKGIGTTVTVILPTKRVKGVSSVSGGQHADIQARKDKQEIEPPAVTEKTERGPDKPYDADGKSIH